MDGVRPTLEDGLRALEEATALAGRIRIELDEEYLHWIALLEARPENKAGADKTGVWYAERVFRAAMVSARPVQRKA